MPDKFGAGYLQPMTGGMLEAAFIKAVKVPGSSLRELMDNMERDNIQTDESGGFYRRGRLQKNSSGRWIRTGRVETT